MRPLLCTITVLLALAAGPANARHTRGECAKDALLRFVVAPFKGPVRRAKRRARWLPGGRTLERVHYEPENRRFPRPQKVAENDTELSIEAMPRRVWAGRRMRLLFHARGVPQGRETKLTWTWAYPSTGHALRSGNRRLGDDGRVELHVTAPAAKNRIRLTLHARLEAKDEVLAKGRRSLDVFPGSPGQVLADVNRNGPVGLVTIGNPSHPLTGIDGLEWEKLEGAVAVRRFDGDLIIVQAARRFPPYSAVAAALEERTHAGTKLACLGESPAPLRLRRLGKPPPPRPVVKARILMPGHGLIGKLRPTDFQAWDADRQVAPATPPLPSGGNYTHVLDRPGTEAPRPLATELRLGRGSLLLCALRVPPNLQHDPAAAHVLANLLRWGARPARKFRTPRVVLDEESDLIHALTEIGLPRGEEDGARPNVLLADGSVLMARDRAAAKDMLFGHRTIVFFGLGAEHVERLNASLQRWWPRRAGERPPQFELVGPAPDRTRETERSADYRPPLLAGIRPRDISELTEHAGGSETKPIRATAESDRFRLLTTGGWLAKYQDENRRFVFWQIPLEKRPRGPQKRALESLLTNLGVRLSAGDR